ncbi:6-carboxyhexanoate--CoA ligase [Alteribacter populi]|uniref:6-carboxyhexanoate--CoA ligase n=1 Tax=Alteribacter populi TaxID=2011011 RepID=UPI000BBB5B4B|nr:6-carboxyhexanoate--CoA ligase [Alteribacter populi]
MTEDKLYSVRMRASKYRSHEQGGKHISGGEMLTSYQDMKIAVNTLLDKALTHPKGNPDFMQIQFDPVDEAVERIKPLHVSTYDVTTVGKGQQLARELLESAGVPKWIIEKAYHLLSEDLNQSGATLIDIHSGACLAKSVRVSRMDWTNANFQMWAENHHLPDNPRMKEALVLASKVNHHVATVAELCWSDDPDYVTGYVASKKSGYERINKLKDSGDENGCRIFFVDNIKDTAAYIHYMEKQPILVQWGENNDT